MRIARSAAVPLYLLLAIVLGGSAQGVWGNLALQLLGIALIAFAAVHRTSPAGSWMSRLPTALLIGALLAVLLQLVPLPPGLWTQLPGHEPLADGFRALGGEIPALPLSLAPFQTTMAVFSLIPPIATFLAIRSLAPEPRWLAIAIVAGTILAIVFGALQVAGGRNSWAYLFRSTNSGAVGFFANQNHMATLLLASIPMGAALLGQSKSDRRSAAGRYGIGAALFVLLVVAIGLNGSLAAMLLALPVLLASVTLLPAAAAWRRFALPIGALALAAGIVFLATRPVAPVADSASANAESIASRSDIWSRTGQAIAGSFPVGTGLGSFEQVYRHYEDPAAVTTEYVNHAHNDYLELVLELGIAGIILILLFLGWWALAASRIWTSQLSTPFARAATIASAAILAHSIVDFPLRTATIACILAAAVALIAQRFRPAAAAERGELRPARHVKLG